MAKELPFDEDVMTLIMGLGGPEEPGQHGRKTVPAPDKTAIDLVMEIRDLCEDFLKTADKKEEEPKEPEGEQPEEEQPETESE